MIGVQLNPGEPTYRNLNFNDFTIHFQISLKCAAMSGNTVDVVQIQNNQIYNFGMFHLTRERTYTTVDISAILQNPECEELKVPQF